MISLPAREASPRTSKLKRSRRHFRLRHPTACLSFRWPLRRDGAGPPRRRLMFFRNSMKPALSLILARTRSEEHTSELQSLMRISYAVFCLKKKNNYKKKNKNRYKNKTTNHVKIHEMKLVHRNTT